MVIVSMTRRPGRSLRGLLTTKSTMDYVQEILRIFTIGEMESQLTEAVPPPNLPSPFVSDEPKADQSQKSDEVNRTSRRAWPVAAAALIVGLILGAAGMQVAATVRETSGNQFWTSLQASGEVLPPSKSAAVFKAKEFCARLDQGKPAQGSPADLLALKTFCPKYAAAFVTTDDAFWKVVQAAGENLPSQAAAIASAKKICAALEGGQKSEGTASDKVGVDFYCSKYSEGFKVLTTKTIVGTFVLSDWDTAKAGCSKGQGGYGDLNTSTSVVVKSPTGAELARTILGEGVRKDLKCSWNFSFQLKEGESSYLVEIGSKRGEIAYTWDRLVSEGVGISLG
jgi:hypothetical protein